MKRAFLLRVLSLLVIVTLSGFMVARVVHADVIATDGHGTFGGENHDNLWSVGATFCTDGVLVQGDQYAISDQNSLAYSLQLAGVGIADTNGKWQDNPNQQIDGSLPNTTTATTGSTWLGPNLISPEYDAPYDVPIAGASNPTALQSGFIVYPFKSTETSLTTVGTSMAVRVERWDHLTGSRPSVSDGYPAATDLYYPSAYEDPELANSSDPEEPAGAPDGDGVAGTDESNFDDIMSVSDTVQGCSVYPIMTASSILSAATPSPLDDPSGSQDPNAPGNWVTNPAGVNIALSASDQKNSSNGNFTTYYSIDGSCDRTTHAGCTTYGGPFNYTTDGAHTIYYFSTNVDGTESQLESRTFRIDINPPTTTAPSGRYSAGTVTLTAADAGSGVAQTYYAWDSTTCSPTNLGACSTGTTATIGTDGSHTLTYFSVDHVGHVESAHTQTYVVDLAAPTINITTPAATTYAINSPVKANYTCTDPLLSDGVTSGSGVRFCTGTVPNGSSIDTSATALGSHTFTVNAQDNVGNSSTPAVVSYTVAYATKLLYDPSSPFTTTQTVQIKLQVQDGLAHNLSSSSLPVTAVGVDKQVANSWQPQPFVGAPFKFSSNVATAGPGYTFPLSTTTYTAGTYRLDFTVAGDPTTHFAGFILVSK